ncbi:hypothetical protein OROMI_000968 [Orobanche minor]
MSASSSRLVDILYEFPILLPLYPLVTLPIFQDRHSVHFQGLLLVIFWVNYGWQRGRGSAVEVDGGMTVLRPKISGLLVKHPRPHTSSLSLALRIDVISHFCGATIVDEVVIIAPAANYVPEPGIQEVRIVDNAMSMSKDIPLQLLSPNNGRVYVSKAQDVVSTVLAKGSLSDKMP